MKLRTIRLNAIILSLLLACGKKSEEESSPPASPAKTSGLAAADTTAPNVESEVPADKASNVSLGQKISITFDEEVIKGAGERKREDLWPLRL